MGESIPTPPPSDHDGTPISTIGKVILHGTFNAGDEIELDSNASACSSESESDNDDSDDASMDFLPLRSFSFSEHEEEDGDQALTDELNGIARLERKLELKRQRLRRLCAGRRPSYVQRLEASTAAADAVTLASYKEKHTTESSHNSNSAATTTDNSSATSDDTPTDSADMDAK